MADMDMSEFGKDEVSFTPGKKGGSGKSARQKQDEAPAPDAADGGFDNPFFVRYLLQRLRSTPCLYHPTDTLEDSAALHVCITPELASARSWVSEDVSVTATGYLHAGTRWRG